MIKSVRLLIDTHAFLWMVLDPDRLSAPAKRRLRDSSTEKHLSLASIWEMAIKLSLGKLRLEDPLGDLIETEAVHNDISLLPVRLDHALAVSTLPFHHRDPFDRILVAQAMSEGMAILSADGVFDQYAVRRVW